MFRLDAVYYTTAKTKYFLLRINDYIDRRSPFVKSSLFSIYKHTNTQIQNKNEHSVHFNVAFDIVH